MVTINFTLASIPVPAEMIQNASNLTTPTISPPGDHVMYMATRVVLLLLMTVVDILALVSNSVLIFVIVRAQHLRTQLSYLFVLSLAICDLISALIILPTAICSFYLDAWPGTPASCSAMGFITALLMFASVLNVSVISVERYYSISSPMDHAANMTLSRVMFILVVVWSKATLIASIPLMGWNSYKYRAAKAYCSYTWDTDTTHRGYIVLVTFFCFILPSTVMAIMHCAIYRVAKTTASRVHPGTTSTAVTSTHLQSLSPPPEIVEEQPNGKHVKISDSHRNGVHTISASVTMSNVPHVMTSPSEANADGAHCSTAQQQTQNVEGAATSRMQIGGSLRAKWMHSAHWKAVRTLMIVKTLFLVLWGPHYLSHLIGAFEDHADFPRSLDLVTSWLGFTSFAVNPFVYGWMNRAVRDAASGLREQAVSTCCRKPPPDEEMDVNEDFFQFLERTSATKGMSVSHRLPQIDLLESPIAELDSSGFISG